MHLIVGLGNPGEEYANTRHNVGFRVIHFLAKISGIKATTFKFKAIIGRGCIEDNKVILAQPQTFMNNSGEAVGLLVNYFKIPLDKIIIIHDDLDLPTGKIRIRLNGSSGGHKGLRSIINTLGSEEISRIRIGIGRPTDRVEVIDYVLDYFEPEEEEEITKSISLAAAAVKSILSEGYFTAMNKYN